MVSDGDDIDYGEDEYEDGDDSVFDDDDDNDDSDNSEDDDNDDGHGFIDGESDDDDGHNEEVENKNVEENVELFNGKPDTEERKRIRDKILTEVCINNVEKREKREIEEIKEKKIFEKEIVRTAENTLVDNKTDDKIEVKSKAELDIFDSLISQIVFSKFKNNTYDENYKIVDEILDKKIYNMNKVRIYVDNRKEKPKAQLLIPTPLLAPPSIPEFPPTLPLITPPIAITPPIPILSPHTPPFVTKPTPVQSPILPPILKPKPIPPPNYPPAQLLKILSPTPVNPNPLLALVKRTILKVKNKYPNLFPNITPPSKAPPIPVWTHPNPVWTSHGEGPWIQTMSADTIITAADPTNSLPSLNTKPNYLPDQDRFWSDVFTLPADHTIKTFPRMSADPTLNFPGADEQTAPTHPESPDNPCLPEPPIITPPILSILASPEYPIFYGPTISGRYWSPEPSLPNPPESPEPSHPSLTPPESPEPSHPSLNAPALLEIPPPSVPTDLLEILPPSVPPDLLEIPPPLVPPDPVHVPPDPVHVPPDPVRVPPGLEFTEYPPQTRVPRAPPDLNVPVPLDPPDVPVNPDPPDHSVRVPLNPSLDARGPLYPSLDARVPLYPSLEQVQCLREYPVDEPVVAPVEPLRDKPVCELVVEPVQPLRDKSGFEPVSL
jgi:hypothetical protein